MTMSDDNITNNNNKMENDEKNDTKECSICFEALPLDSFSILPCCGLDGREETSTIKVCNGCLIILSIPSSPSTTSNDNNATSKIGKCPRCRYWLSITTTKDPIDGLEKGTQTLHQHSKTNIVQSNKHNKTRQSRKMPNM